VITGLALNWRPLRPANFRIRIFGDSADEAAEDLPRSKLTMATAFSIHPAVGNGIRPTAANFAGGTRAASVLRPLIS
jgi:hypothetical protein